VACGSASTSLAEHEIELVNIALENKEIYYSILTNISRIAIKQSLN